ncbi:MAG TPA: hypothetical protein VFK45_10665, partial [Gammaproteobacteria bacterium]|nr:hypothetical protein [Gammaproteobacteria bacterium]
MELIHQLKLRRCALAFAAATLLLSGQAWARDGVDANATRAPVLPDMPMTRSQLRAHGFVPPASLTRASSKGDLYRPRFVSGNYLYNLVYLYDGHNWRLVSVQATRIALPESAQPWQRPEPSYEAAPQVSAPPDGDGDCGNSTCPSGGGWNPDSPYPPPPPDPHNFPPPSGGPYPNGETFNFGQSCWNGYWNVSGTWQYVITAGGA